MNTEDLIDEIIRREGSEYTNHPADRGGPTRYGITLATLKAARGVEMNATDVRALTESDARQIYRTMYVKPFEKIMYAPLKSLLVDCAVNHGVKRATLFLQQVLMVHLDGIIGPNTLAAWEREESKHGGGARVYYAVLAERLRFYGRIMTNTPSQSVFAAGWMSRCAEFVKSTEEL